MPSYESSGSSDIPDPYRVEHGEGYQSDPVDHSYRDSDAIVADNDGEFDIDDNGEATPVRAESVTEHRYSIVEIGGGGSPLLMSPYAPDMQRLFNEGGVYTGIDANAAMLARGAKESGLFLQVYTNPEATIDTNFVSAALNPDAPVPPEVEQDSADRVIIGNVFTLPTVAREPEICRAIAEGAARMVRKEPAGEVVVIGTYSPEVFRAGMVTELMASVGLEHIGPDDLAEYFPPDQRDMTFMNPACYVERYRPRAEQQ